MVVIRGQRKFWREKAEHGEKAEVRSRSRWDEWEEWRLPTATSVVFIERLHRSALWELSEKETEKGESGSKVEETKMEEGEVGEKPTRRSGFGLGCSGVALPCGGHKGSRRILILVSPNLLTYLTYPRSSRRIHPAPWDNSILFSPTQQSPLLLFASLFSSFFILSSRSPFPLLPLLPVFSGAALR